MDYEPARTLWEEGDEEAEEEGDGEEGGERDLVGKSGGEVFRFVVGGGAYDASCAAPDAEERDDRAAGKEVSEKRKRRRKKEKKKEKKRGREKKRIQIHTGDAQEILLQPRRWRR